jgi:hypothetical protein
MENVGGGGPLPPTIEPIKRCLALRPRVDGRPVLE